MPRKKKHVTLEKLHAELERCRRCPGMQGPAIHGPPVKSKVMLIGQAPGPHEHKVMKPFGWTAGKTLFRWFEQALGWDEETCRARIYIAAVARCFPGKAMTGSDAATVVGRPASPEEATAGVAAARPKTRGDRKPDRSEMENCRPWLEREVKILKPELLIPVGSLAIEQVLGKKGPLVEFVGRAFETRYHGVTAEVIALPHPSGASTWHHTEPGATHLKEAMKLLKSKLPCRFPP